MVDGKLYSELGRSFYYALGCEKDAGMAKQCYQRAIDLGYQPAYFGLFTMLWEEKKRLFNLTNSKDRAILTLLELEKKGEGVKDDRVLGRVVDCLREQTYQPSRQVLGRFRTKGEMALHYCDVLIQRKSHLGYDWKAHIYNNGEAGIRRNGSKVLAIYEEADRVGLATLEAYTYHLAACGYVP